MVLESTIICVDNSDFMRNGDFVPTRLQAQQDAVNMICHSKTRSNPENNVGLLVMSNVEVLTTLTADVGRILSKLHQVQPKGNITFCTAVKVAHLALKHRQGRNHKMRIVVFVGSPVEDDEKEIVKLAKKLKKEKVNVDVINFGEESINTEKLTEFINTINGKEGTSSHLVTVPPGPLLSEALVNSPVVVGEDGSGAAMQAVGFEFGVDPNEEPELALALRVSMEEQRARQEEEARKAAAKSVAESAGQSTEATYDEAQLEQAISMSMAQESTGQTPSVLDYSSLSEEEQTALALQLSMQNSGNADSLLNSVYLNNTLHFGLRGRHEHIQLLWGDVELKSDSAGKEYVEFTERATKTRTGASTDCRPFLPKMFEKKADNTPAPMEVDDAAGAESSAKSDKAEKPEDDDYSDVMNDPDFLQGVLENLPGVDPQNEEFQKAMSSLISKDGAKKDDKKDDKDKK